MTLTRLVARPLLASMFVAGGAHALRDAPALAPAAEPVLDKVAPAAQKVAPALPVPTDPTTAVRVHGAVQLLAGLALATGRAPRTSAAVLAAGLVPTTLAAHRFWEHEGEDRTAQRIHFLKNASMLGGLLVAAVDTEGRPGVAWRAGHAARDARREARHLAATAKREARLAAAQVR